MFLYGLEGQQVMVMCGWRRQIQADQGHLISSMDHSGMST